MLTRVRREGIHEEAAKEDGEELKETKAMRNNGASNEGVRDRNDVSTIMALVRPELESSLKDNKKDRKALYIDIGAYIVRHSALTWVNLVRNNEKMKSKCVKRFARNE